MTERLRAGLHSGQQYGSVAEIVRLWTDAEDLGYRWISMFDHWRPEIGGPEGPCLDAAVTLTAALAGTSRAMGALMVAPAHAYDPGRLAMRAVALDQVSGGRFTLGLGSGGTDRGYTQFGLHRPGPGDRAEILDELAPLVRRLLRGEVVDHQGPHFRLDRAVVRPLPVSTGVPIAIGGAGPRVLASAGRHADIWNTLAAGPARFADNLGTVRRAAEAVGRDPHAIRPSLSFRAVIGLPDHVDRERAGLGERQGGAAPDAREYVSWGSVDDCLRALQPYVEAGAQDLVLACRPPLDRASVEAFVTEVLPRLEDAAC